MVSAWSEMSVIERFDSYRFPSSLTIKFYEKPITNEVSTEFYDSIINDFFRRISSFGFTVLFSGE
jgi:hypothetical protein